MSITRIESGSRASQAVIHNGTVYLAGQVGTPGDDVATQTKTILQNIERLLEAAGSSKNHILSAMIWLADMADYEAMNGVWDAWVAQIDPPTRATGESRLAAPEYRIEIMIVAATV
ncbi:RidA family protein [Novosphingobium resinovorum]|uniref:RidA family protein n=1 Tax=Novosphingobium resinovorum TaxID=158500 RepID=UPI002ED2E971|nr:RidA family protein [Novosphingobium resinovorum]